MYDFMLFLKTQRYKGSVLRRRCSDTNRYKKVGVLPIRIIKSNVSTVGFSFIEIFIYIDICAHVYKS